MSTIMGVAKWERDLWWLSLFVKVRMENEFVHFLIERPSPRSQISVYPEENQQEILLTLSAILPVMSCLKLISNCFCILSVSPPCNERTSSSPSPHLEAKNATWYPCWCTDSTWRSRCRPMDVHVFITDEISTRTNSNQVISSSTC